MIAVDYLPTIQDEIGPPPLRPDADLLPAHLQAYACTHEELLSRLATAKENEYEANLETAYLLAAAWTGATKTRKGSLVDRKQIGRWASQLKTSRSQVKRLISVGVSFPRDELPDEPLDITLLYHAARTDDPVATLHFALDHGMSASDLKRYLDGNGIAHWLEILSETYEGSAEDIVGTAIKELTAILSDLLALPPERQPTSLKIHIGGIFPAEEQEET